MDDNVNERLQPNHSRGYEILNQMTDESADLLKNMHSNAQKIQTWQNFVGS